jgi:hypothetical protein
MIFIPVYLCLTALGLFVGLATQTSQPIWAAVAAGVPVGFLVGRWRAVLLAPSWVILGALAEALQRAGALAREPSEGLFLFVLASLVAPSAAGALISGVAVRKLWDWRRERHIRLSDSHKVDA